MNFTAKTVVITGAAQGIGKQIALAFARQKAIIIALDLNEEGLKNLQSEVGQYSECAYYALDVTNAEQVGEVINKIIDKF
ncbi:MAG: SDR family NAD(P)-dependent oxidoreductase, partial [Candidatus Omnitrophota bacterium]